MQPFQMTAGETLEIKTVWRSTEENQIPSDFSITAAGASGSLTITTSEAGFESDTMPVLGLEP